MQNDTDTTNPPTPPPSRPTVRRSMAGARLPGYTIFYTCLAGVAGGLLILPIAWWQGWGHSWIAACAIAAWRGLLLGAWAVMADRSLPSLRRPYRWGLVMFMVGLVPDLEIGLFAYVAFVTRAFDYPLMALLMWIVVAAIRDGLLGVFLGETVESPRGAAWKSVLVAIGVWGGYRVLAIMADGPLLGLPVKAYESLELLIQMTMCLLVAAGLMGWAFAARLRDPLRTSD